MLKISKEQIDDKKAPKMIGNMAGSPVFEIFTKGGLAMVIMKTETGQTKILGAAPHRAIARNMAVTNYPDFMMVELSKSEEDRYLISAAKDLMPYLNKLVGQLNNKLDE